MVTYDNDGNEVKNVTAIARYERPLYFVDQRVEISLFERPTPAQIRGVSRSGGENWEYQLSFPQAEFWFHLYGVAETDILGPYYGETPRKPVKAANE